MPETNQEGGKGADYAQYIITGPPNGGGDTCRLCPWLAMGCIHHILIPRQLL